jgi:hypothetical protein
MKNYVKLFEEFVLTNPSEEAALKRQFATSAVTAAVPVTHSVSQIVQTESGMHVKIGDKNKIAVVVSSEVEK